MYSFTYFYWNAGSKPVISFGHYFLKLAQKDRQILTIFFIGKNNNVIKLLLPKRSN